MSAPGGVSGPAALRAWSELRRLTRRTAYDASGKVVVVTGGAGGIGSALARTLAERGASLVVVDLDLARAQDVASSLPHPTGRGHLAVGGDLTDPDAIAAAVLAVEQRHGRVDVLVNNTGMTSSERFGTRSPESIAREIEVNTVSPLLVTRAFLDLLRRSEDARVVTTVSLAGIFPQAETPVYCASKFGLRGAMLSIALDLRHEGIRVSSVLPSATDTPMLAREAVEGGNALQFQTPPQTPADVVRAVVSLLDRPRLEAYPLASQSRLVRLAMTVPNLLPVLLPFFEGAGEVGMADYLRRLEDRGEVRRVDGRPELVA